ncbi:hypothetical protein C4588_06200 [Candidatus Parcubacteria bacterium]|nr:MAG: hypothetical protein C4588_06200 [Candidatus Parcubacteria bacterium]
MHRGFVKLWRKSQDSRVFNNADLWKVWTWCLMRANHEENWVTIKTGKGDIDVLIGPGQFVFGRDSAAKELRMKTSSVRNRIEKLKNMKNIDIKSDSQYSIISIINWDSYQPKNDECGQAKGQPKDSQRTAKGQPKDTEKNDKNIYSSNFLEFWGWYPRRVGKGAAWKAYCNIKKPTPMLSQIRKAIESQKKSKEWQDPQFIPHPSTWLNQRRWEDEPDQPVNQEKTLAFTVSPEDL